MKTTGTIRKRVLMCFGLAVLVSSSAFAQLNEQTGGEKDPSGYGAWDPNTDTQIDENEFFEMFGNGDYYSQWDADGDGMLAEEEWKEGFSDTYEDREYDGAFGDWDSNSDGYLDSDEYSAGTFNMWDEDGNGYIDNDEYDIWNKKINGNKDGDE